MFLSQKSGKSFEYGFMALLILCIPAAVFVGMYYLLTFFFFPLVDNEVGHTIYYAALITLGLAVPYFSLKMGMHYARLANPHEKELKLKDIPKDHEQIREIRR